LLQEKKMPQRNIYLPETARHARQRVVISAYALNMHAGYGRRRASLMPSQA
jgi:hypothetical protein